MNPEYPRSLLDSDAPDTGQIAELAQHVGNRLQEHSDAVISDMSFAIQRAIKELDGDSDMYSALHASVSGNVQVILEMLADKTPANQIPPIPAAIHYAVQLAQQDVAESALRRAYHVGSDCLLAHAFDQVQQVDCDSDMRLRLFHYIAGWTHQYVDEITRVVIAAHEEERRYSSDRQATTIAFHVSRALTGQRIDDRKFHAETGYLLDQVHIGALVWIEGANAATDQTDLIMRVAARLKDPVGSQSAPLVTIFERNAARMWFGCSNDRIPVHTSAVADVIGPMGDIRIAFGAPGPGAGGFRATLAQAEQVATVARATASSNSHVVSFADDGMAVISRLAENIGFARHWVHEVLGVLAEDTSYAQRQRETIRIFLGSAGSYLHTAEQLTMHRNSIKYRLRRAEDELGRPLTERRLDTQLAVALCHSLGTVVLAKPE